MTSRLGTGKSLSFFTVCNCLALVPVSLGDGLDLVGLRLGRQLDGGDELLLLPHDLLGLDLDLFPSFNHLTIAKL